MIINKQENNYSLAAAIGNTPLVALPALNEETGCRFFAKLETSNPSGSVKDRVAQSLIAAAQRDGKLQPGQTIIEATSGNTGIALAMLTRASQYKLKLVVPDNTSPERLALLQAYQADIVFSPGAEGSNGAVRRARQLAADDQGYYWIDQYSNQANIAAHYQGTGLELVNQLAEINAFVAGLGTGGTLMGVSKRLKGVNRETIIAAAEPRPGEQVQGLRSLDDGFIPEILDLSAIDRKILVSAEETLFWTRWLLQRAGIFAGPSAGAAAAVANKISQDLDSGNIVLLIPDSGWRYLSLGIYSPDYQGLEEGQEDLLWW
jgi:cysteine synthase B